MRNKRIQVFQQSLEELVESIDATLRLSSWDVAEAVPEPLKESASKLMARMAVSDRLVSGVFNGNSRDAAHVRMLTDAMRRLDAAYLAYVKKLESDFGREKARNELSAALDQVRTELLSVEVS
jgi:Zn-dependent M16 (insulinase) family peptidase